MSTQQDLSQEHATAVVGELPTFHGVRFDPEAVALVARYSDELSVYRARRAWIETLEQTFLLVPDHDYTLIARCNAQQKIFSLQCRFVTACARYAFWRLTNNQAPEAQYMIETAHIPRGELREFEFVTAPDLCSLHDCRPTLLSCNESGPRTVVDRWREFLNRLTGKINRHIEDL